MLYSRVMTGPGELRIGELSRRSGVSPELLRAWERRYSLLQPARSAGGLRLYSLDDLSRVQAMQKHLSEGFAAAGAGGSDHLCHFLRRSREEPARRGARELRRRRRQRGVRRAARAFLTRHRPARRGRPLPP